jgi:hypothetical protein
MRLHPMLLILTVVGAAAIPVASCGTPASSGLGESCTRTGDCLQGKCIDLKCKSTSVGCSTDSECVGDSSGSRCHFSCSCLTDSDCASATSSTGTRNPYCFRTSTGDDGGYSFCSSVR